MNSDRLLFTGLPAALTVLLHGGVIVLLVVKWVGPVEVVAAAPSIQPIQARLVSADSVTPKKATVPKKSTPKPKPKPKPEPEPKPEPKTAPEPAKKPAPKVTETPPQVTPPPAKESLTADQLAILTRNELENMVAAERLGGDAQAPSLRDLVAASIRAAVINKWTRPPSARNGMVSVLSIQLVPTGEVVGVGVLQSSGDSAFDRSAMTAVERVARFPEVTQLDDPEFERNFRRFQLIFKPEDLRY